MSLEGPAIVLGRGDGSVLKLANRHPQVVLIPMPGEEGAPPSLIEAHKILRHTFMDHLDCMRLGGAEIYETHPLSPEAEEVRRQWAPQLIERLAHYIESPGNDWKDTWTGAKHALQHGSLLYTRPTGDDLFDFYKGLPAICLAAGPSAQAALPRIRELQDQAVVFCVDVMLQACLENGIRPDFVCAHERTPDTAKCLEGLDTEGMTLIAPVVIEPAVVRQFRDDVIWYWRPDNLDKWLHPGIMGRNIGNSVGTQAVGAALIAGCDPVWLVGHDLCMSGRETHAGSAHQLAKDLVKQLEAHTDYYAPQHTLTWDGRQTVTTKLWRLYQADIEYFMLQAPGRRVYNASNGIHLAGSEDRPLPARFGPRLAYGKPFRGIHGHLEPDRKVALLADVGRIRERCKVAKTPEDLLISTIVSEKTALFWSEMTRTIYYAAVLRHYLKGQDYDANMLRHVAVTVSAIAEVIGKAVETDVIE